jgi:hypothetical protein
MRNNAYLILNEKRKENLQRVAPVSLLFDFAGVMGKNQW